MTLVIFGVIVLVIMAVVFHLLQEYLWAVVFFICAMLLGSYVVVLANLGTGSGP